MAGSLLDEIKQRQPFQSLEEEAFLNILRTAQVLSDGIEALLRPYGISRPQYNVLRILRGAGPAGLGRNEVRDRLLTRMPDVTRLLDHLESSHLVQRQRGQQDRRAVTAHLTPQGLALVNGLDEPVRDLIHAQLGHLTPENLRHLSDLLLAVRSPTSPR